MKKQIYIATVQIAVEVEEGYDPESYACDAISECLTGNLIYNGAIIDWSYLQENGVVRGPVPVGIVELDDLEEGAVFQLLKQ